MSTQVLLTNPASEEVVDIDSLFCLLDSLTVLSDDEPELEVSDVLQYLKDTALKCEN